MKVDPDFDFEEEAIELLKKACELKLFAAAFELG